MSVGASLNTNDLKADVFWDKPGDVAVKVTHVPSGRWVIGYAASHEAAKSIATLRLTELILKDSS